MSTVLITGGAGFIGSHLVDAYLAKGCNVLVLDDMSTGSWDNLKSSLSKYDFDRLKVEQISLESYNPYDSSYLKKFVVESDFVFHLAATVGVEKVLDNPSRCIHNNIISTRNVLKACMRYERKVLLTSTSEVYGMSYSLEQTEVDAVRFGCPQYIRWSYGASKYVDELMAMSMYRQGLDPIIARLFNTIGPRQSGEYGMVVPKFIEQALNNEPITVYGDGQQKRTFTSVYDVVDALMKIMDNDMCVGEVINVGGVWTTTITALAYRIKSLVGSTSDVVHDYDTIELMNRRLPSIDKLKDLIDYKPREDFDECLMEIIEWVKSS